MNIKILLLLLIVPCVVSAADYVPPSMVTNELNSSLIIIPAYGISSVPNPIELNSISNNIPVVDELDTDIIDVQSNEITEVSMNSNVIDLIDAQIMEIVVNGVPSNMVDTLSSANIAAISIDLSYEYGGSSMYWTYHQSSEFDETSAAEWEDLFALYDNPNNNVVADTNDVTKLRIYNPLKIDFTNDQTVATFKADLLAHKAKGYNTLSLTWVLGINTDRTLDMLTWAKSEFDKVILVPSILSRKRNEMPSVSDATTELDSLLTKADIVLLGFDSTIDGVINESDERIEEITTRWFRIVEARAALKNIPIWGSSYMRFHGTNQKYQYTPDNHTAYVCANLFPPASRVLLVPNNKITEALNKTSIPQGKPVMLAFHGVFANADKLVKIYNNRGYGTLKIGSVK